MDTVSQWGQGIYALVAYEVHRSTPSTAATVWSAHSFAFFASKRNAPVPSVPARHMNESGVKKSPFFVVLHGWLSGVILVVDTATPGHELLFGQNCIFSVAIEDIR